MSKIPKPKFIKEYAKRIPTEDVYFNIYQRGKKDGKTEVVEEILPYLHQIRAEIPFTYGKHARKKMKELIKKLDSQT